MKRANMCVALVLPVMLAACGAGNDPDPKQYGANPALPEREGGLLPSMEIAKPTQWGEQRPTVPQGYTITAIASDLKIPRQTLLLPNGDILVAEGRGGGAPKLRLKDFIAGKLKAKGNTTVESGDRLTLLRYRDVSINSLAAASASTAISSHVATG